MVHLYLEGCREGGDKYGVGRYLERGGGSGSGPSDSGQQSEQSMTRYTPLLSLLLLLEAAAAAAAAGERAGGHLHHRPPPPPLLHYRRTEERGRAEG